MNRKEHSIKNAKEIDYERTTGMIKMQASYIGHDNPSRESGPLPHNYRLEPIGEAILIQKFDGKTWTTLCDMPDVKAAGKHIRRLEGWTEISQASQAKLTRWANLINCWIAGNIQEKGIFPLYPGKEASCLLFAYYDLAWQELGMISSRGEIEHFSMTKLPALIFQEAGITDY